MVKCLECGAEERRLQWTHFKFKCTGRFQNGKEYMAAYPGAKVVDPELAASTAVTLNNLIKKYGEDEGKIRWDQYKQKQAYSNSYEYKNKKHGWTLEEFNQYNSSRAITIENMIQKHGEEVGVNLWEKYCERQAYTNTLNYFVEKYGTDLGKQKYIEVNRKKGVNNPEFLSEQLGVSLDEAVDIILSRQRSGIYSSNLELEFVDCLEQEIKTSFEYSNKTKPFGKWSIYLNTYVVYDIKHLDCIIEFNGDYWHANPKMFLPEVTIRGTKAKDIWNRDQLKLQTARDLGYRVLTVWESDFKNNKEETLKQVAKWILQEQK